MSIGGLLQGRALSTAIGGWGSPSLDSLPSVNRFTVSFVEEGALPALPDDALDLEFSDNRLCFRTTLDGSTQSGGQDGFFVRSVDRDVAIQLSVSGNNLSLQIKATRDTPHAEFVASTLHAALGLAGEGTVFVRVAGRRLRCTKFDLSLKTISQMLRSRQVAYRLMVIERATGLAFELPPRYSGSEIQTITFVYRAVVDRSFTWPLKNHPIRVKAVPEELAKLNKAPSTMRFLGDANNESLLGEPVHLGRMGLVIEQGIIQNFDEFIAEMAAGDGDEVEGVVLSLTGTALIETPEAPRLLADVWDDSERALIDLKPILSARLAEQYNRLAASTLEGLSESEKEELTARPELDDEGLFPDDSDGE